MGRAFGYNMRLISLVTLIFLAAAVPPAMRADEARDAVDAARLFDDGQNMLHAGRYGAAAVTFRTLLYVYPESNLAAQAKLALQQSEDLEAHEPVVRSIRFQIAGGPTLEQIRACFAAREVALAVRQPYEPRDVERARVALQGLLADQGKPMAVKADVHSIRHAAAGREWVEVVFTSAKK